MERAIAADMTGNAGPKLRILHVLRAPVGGLFRHVLDLSQAQIARGHEVGLVTDLNTGGDAAKTVLARLEPSLKLGLLRLPMHRQPSPLDFATAIKIARHARKLGIDVAHGHGAKGGLYTRLPLSGFVAPVKAYTPHGGSFSITMPYALQRFYMFVEKLLEPFTDAFLFESAFAAARFADHVGRTNALVKINPNGISPSEFSKVDPEADAADFVYVGELRIQKGLDVLLDAMAELSKAYGKGLRLVLVGNGPHKDHFVARVAALGLQEQVIFSGPMPAREAFRRGRILVLPSLGESLPYVVLEAAGAEVPIVATNVGDIGNILSPYSDRLVPANDCGRLIIALRDMLDKSPIERQHDAEVLAALTAERFTISNMVDNVLAIYHEALERKALQQRQPKPSFALLS